jgi:translation initiation factor 2B subunit (eIF-2B alpha/beta/delta family)
VSAIISSETSPLVARFAALRKEGRKALVVYVTAGHPDPASSVELLRALESAVADVISVVEGAGTAVISDNLFAGTLHGAIIGMEYDKRATGDLALAGAERYPQLRIRGNQVS